MTTPLTVIPFDFRAPPRIPESLYQRLQMAQLRFAPLAQGILAGRLRQSCDVEPIAPVSVTLPEYLNSCVPPAVRFVCALGHFPGQSLVLNFTPGLAAHAVARLFGGESAAEESRPLTGLELSILSDLVQRILTPLAEAGRPDLSLETTLTGPAGDGAPEIATLGDTLISVAWSVHCGVVEGTLSCILPAAIFADPVATDNALPARELTNLHVRTVSVPLDVRLHLRLAAVHLTRLREGYVLETGKPSHAEVEVSAYGRPLFGGVLGRHHGHVGVQLTRVITPDPDAPTANRRTPS